MRRSLWASATWLGVCAGAAAQPTPVGNEFRINSYINSSQSFPAVAMDSDGDFVVVWHSYQDGDDTGVFARRFSAAGVAQGLEFQVNLYTVDFQAGPALGMAADGRFVVAWRSANGQDGSYAGVFARRFDGAGNGLGVEFQVNSYTNDPQLYPTVSMSDAGDFVIAWQSDPNQDGSGRGVFARRFNASGVAQATEFQVNSYTPSAQSRPSATSGPDGDFVVAWSSSSQDGFDYGVFARRFNSAGVGQAAEFQVNSYTVGTQDGAKVGIDGDGVFLVTWASNSQDGSSFGIFARRLATGGVAPEAEFAVNSYTLGFQSLPAIGIDADGDVVLTWASDGQDGGGTGIFARQFDASAIGQGVELQVNTFTAGAQTRPVLSVDPGGDFVVVWQSFAQDGSFYGVFAQRFAVPKVFDIDDNGAVEPLTDGLLFLRHAFGFRGATLVAGAVAVDCARCTPLLIETYIAGLGAVTRAGRTGPEFQINSYTGGFQTNPAVAAGGDAFVVTWSSAHDGAGTGVFARRFDETGAPLAGEVQVNTYVTGNQTAPAIDVDGEGDFVVAWATVDASGYRLMAQRFHSSGTPLGTEIQVSANSAGDQQPAIALDADGDFVVAWSSPRDGYHDIFARRFNSAGVPQAGEFQVNTYTTLVQLTPTLAMSAGGDFVIAWESLLQDGYSWGVFAQRFVSGGTKLAAEFQVNAHTADNEIKPAVAIGAAGFVVAWSSDHDGDQYGIFARRFDGAGSAQATEFQVNSYTSGTQYGTAAVVDSGGELVISWASALQDGSEYGVFARRFSGSGVPQAVEFRVNAYLTGDQKTPALAMHDSGDFVVVWQSEGQDGSNDGVFAQRFAVEKAADIDGNGAVAPLTDGLLILRYLFGFRGTTLITGAVAPDCTRCTAPVIEAYLAGKV